MKKSFLLLLLLNSLLISACSTVAKNGEELTEESLSHERRTREVISLDKDIETEAYSELNSDDEVLNQSHFTITAYNGAVLVTGETPSEALEKKLFLQSRAFPM
jgi:osmotically-inducible protein OsmY